MSCQVMTEEPDSESHDFGPAPVVSDLATENVDGGRETTPGDSTSIYLSAQVGGVREGLSLLSHRTRMDCVHFWHCLLTDRMKLVARETIITSTTLMDPLGTAIIENTPQDLSGDRANYEQNIQDVMASFPKGMSMFALTL